MDSLKTWVIEVGLKKMGPTAMASAISALFALLAAHQGLLEQWGITYGIWPLQWATGQAPSGHVILIELDTVSTAALTVFAGLVTAIMAASQHHVAATMTGKPQNGDVRTEPNVAVEGGQRASDPPKP